MGKYVNSQAKLLKDQLPLHIAALQISGLQKSEVARFLWTTYKQEVMRRLDARSAENLGQIAYHGRSAKDGHGTPLSALDLELDAQWAGHAILRTLAAATLVAALTDQVWTELHPEDVQQVVAGLAAMDDRTRSDRMFEEAGRFMDHCRSSIGGLWYYESIQCQALRVVVGCMFSLPVPAIKKKIQLFDEKVSSWVPAEKDLSIVLEVVEETRTPTKGTVFAAWTCGPNQASPYGYSVTKHP